VRHPFWAKIMTQAVKQHVVVEPDGRIVIYVPQLKPGTHADVIVVEQAELGAGDLDGGNRLSSLIGSCRGMFATPEEADDFLAREREAWDS
jgi:hypothetical protein